MRFKARLFQDMLLVVEGVIMCLEKATAGATPTVLLHLSPGGAKLALPTASTEEPQVFAELAADKLFAEYRIESQSDDCILLEAGLANLARAFRSGRAAPLCLLKLTKRRGQPCLCLETRALEVDVTHDIPVKVLKAAEIEAYAPPEVPAPSVQLELPASRQLRTVVDRLKPFDRYVSLDGDMHGSLTLRAQSGEASIKTFFPNLSPRFDGFDDEAAAANNVATVRVDGRKLANVLAFYGVPCEAAIACFVEGVSFVLHVFLAPAGVGTVTYYLPVGVEEGEWMNGPEG
uniref:Checkpoint protein n=1 Tax=Phaeomonas parva TaxID=124430 RepID=A0A7S1TZY9_9STRA|mmetsp:Transcript_24800/g.77773  ORF Transcript_24800/g.77773 Transcript_24800/m.77773 type:complete len:289 (+) Transcript_24800:259-1125(+)|eukprot:CAMPEP_0118860594 /NCGR_PEP_ID=MMETSP1163-20130328/6389_1 /TAXON_ID=124430 /ORGANISM="Phaeomonas parva, Strain CCMP2877" /LENGTH=288 /DNA_ID=CAMNT_0006794305 /DNA_START=198 /DNA_END=1064 /DNA_ORIENTATION=-